MLNSDPNYLANLKTLRELIAQTPDDQYSFTQWGDNLTMDNIFDPPETWTGPGCALGHAFRSGLFPELKVTIDDINVHRKVFGQNSDFLFASECFPADVPTEGKEAREYMLQSLDGVIALREEVLAKAA